METTPPCASTDRAELDSDASYPSNVLETVARKRDDPEQRKRAFEGHPFPAAGAKRRRTAAPSDLPSTPINTTDLLAPAAANSAAPFPAPEEPPTNVPTLDSLYTELIGPDCFDLSVTAEYTGSWGNGWGLPLYVNPLIAKIKTHIAQMEQDPRHKHDNQSSTALKHARQHIRWLKKSVMLVREREAQKPSPYLKYIPNQMGSKVFYDIRTKRVREELDKQKREHQWADGFETDDWKELQGFWFWLDWGAKIMGVKEDKAEEERKKREKEKQLQDEKDRGEAEVRRQELKAKRKREKLNGKA